MSEYADINIKKLSICYFRNYLNNKMVSLLFSKKDLIITPDFKENIDDDTVRKYEYKTTVKKAKERLDAQGYSISNFERLFNANVSQAVDYTSFQFDYKIDLDDDAVRKRIEKNVSFKKWKNAMKKIISYELEKGNIGQKETEPGIKISTECERVIYSSLKSDSEESYYALYSEVIQEGYILRLILDFCEDEDEVLLDFTYLAFWADDCIQKGLSAADNVEKTIVLVEGTSDKNILEFSLEQIYPHLSDLFYFMDFDDVNGGKRDGGTSYVIKNLKTFYFSKINIKFIAIFDNDAEGYQSKCSLINEIKNWPCNFKILLYPESKLFLKYPTLAPNGKTIIDNINKKACSIELYLPDEIIMDNGTYYPIEWESRKKIKTVGEGEKSIYQGVISQKDNIKDKFFKLRDEVIEGKQPFIIEHWSRMKCLMDTIVYAFK